MDVVDAAAERPEGLQAAPASFADALAGAAQRETPFFDDGQAYDPMPLMRPLGTLFFVGAALSGCFNVAIYDSQTVNEAMNGGFLGLGCNDNKLIAALCTRRTSPRLPVG